MTSRTLSGKRFTVESTSPIGVVNSDTVFEFQQQDELVWARYSGGKVKIGRLVGLISEDELKFSFCQVHGVNEVKAGSSTARVEWDRPLIRIVEEFTWADGSGSGVNVFVEIGKN